MSRWLSAVLASISFSVFGLDTPSSEVLTDLLKQSVFEADEGLSSWGAIYRQLFDLDVSADEAWRHVESEASFDARRRTVRERMVACIGGFPARTPLNAKVTGVVRRSNYRIEKILFESRPGAYVTGNLYVPEDARFAAPYPAALEVCGHSPIGKNAPKYQRVAVLSAKCGIAVLVIDPLGQGERFQCEEDCDGKATVAHLRLGVNAMLLDHGLAAFEMWDAIRALDYLDSRGDLRHDGYGALGNSGGGTQSIMLSALDDRIKVTASSCFLSNLREQTAWRLLADSEQLIFAQLREGLNHAGYLLLSGRPVLMLARWSDIIPFTGTRETFRLAASLDARFGWGRYSMFDLAGPHGYCEPNMRETASFLAEKLRGEKVDLSVVDEDCGLPVGESLVTPTGRVMDEPGFKSAYAYLQEEMAAAEAARKNLSRAERAALVRRLADIDERRLGARMVISSVETGGVKVVRAAFSADGYRVPVVELVPSPVQGAPALVVGDENRVKRLAAVKRLIDEGRPVMVADVVATGEIGAARHHYFNPHDDEETAKMLYLIGSSLVGRRAGEIVALARDLKARSGQAPTVVAYGRTAVAAAHAFAADPETFAGVETVDPPLSWRESVRTRGYYDYAAAVQGALLHYDWCDLLPVRATTEPAASAEPFAGLHRDWAKALAVPARYAFTNKVEFVKAWRFDDYDVEFYRQANGPGTSQRVFVSLPKKREGRCPAVVVPFYYPESMLGFDPETGEKFPKFEKIAMLKDLAQRGFIAASADSYHLTYLKDCDRPRTDFSRWRLAGAALQRDWPEWTGVGKLVADTRLVVDLLTDDSRVDAGQIGIIGHSLGGKMAFYTGCLDPRIKVIVTSDWGIVWDSTNWKDIWYWGDRVEAMKAAGHTHAELLDYAGGKPFMLIAGLYDGAPAQDVIARAAVYRSHPERAVLLNHATGHRPPPEALEAGYRFLERHLRPAR